MFEREKRIPSIDRFRGIAIALMIMFTATEMYTATDFFVPLSTHDLTKALLLIPGYGFFDLIAPFFIFASGLSFGFAFSSAERKVGLPAAYSVMGRKGVKVVGLGSLLLFSFDGIGLFFFVCAILCLTLLVLRFTWKKSRELFSYDILFDKILFALGILLLIVAVADNLLLLFGKTPTDSHWTALPSIGVSMLVCVAFSKRKPYVKVTAVYLLTLLVFLMNLYIPQGNFAYFTHGGFLGSFGYALLFLCADTVVTLQKMRKTLAHTFAATIGILAVTSCAIIVPSKAAVNVSYALVSFVFAYVLYFVVSLFDKVRVKKFPLLTLLGQNSLMIYMWHVPLSPMVGLMENGLIAYWPVSDGMRVVLGFMGMAVYLFGTYAVVWALQKRKIRFRI